MADTSYPPSNVATTAPGAAYPPPNVQPVANEPSIRARAPSQLDVIAHVETGNRNIPQQIHDINTDRGTPAQGNFQFITPTWQRYAPRAGVDVSKYPTAMSAPPSVQAQVAAVTPINQWGPNTVAALKRAFPNLDTSKPPTSRPKAAVRLFLAPPLSSVAPTEAAPPKPPPTVGSLLAGLAAPTGADGKGPSEIQQAGQAAGGGGQQSQPAAPQPDLQGQQAAAMGGQARQQQLAAMGQQSAAAMGARGGQPLTWGSAPPGSGYGPQTPPMTMGYWGGVPIPMPAHVVAPGAGAGQQIPGTTLNSIGAV